MSEAQALLADIATSLGRYTYRPSDEAELQTMVADVLIQTGLPCDREVIQGVNRYDLVVVRSGVRVVLELKVTGTAPAVERQAQRYALTDGVHGVAVVTTSQRLARQLVAPPACKSRCDGREPFAELGGKAFAVIALRAM